MKWNIKHVKQFSKADCGAAAFSSISGLPLKESIPLCKTDKNLGTYTEDAKNAFEKLNIPVLRVNYNLNFKAAQTYLKLLSFQYPLYVAAEYRSGGGRGRDYVRQHVIAIWRGEVYDGGEKYVFPIESYNHTYNKSLFIKDVLICGLAIDN